MLSNVWGGAGFPLLTNFFGGCLVASKEKRVRDVSSESGAGFPSSTVLSYLVSVFLLGLGSIGSDVRTSGESI